MASSIIYHISTNNDWKQAQQDGYYSHPSLEKEGFIHCSEERQVSGVLDRYFQGQSNLCKLVIDASKLAHSLRYDWSASTEDSFPHIYGPINLDAIIDVIPLR
jgi:uncharacterized protein (DUF952 family)